MAKKEANIGELTPAEIREFKALLLEKQNEILANVICMEDETLRKPRTDLSNLPFHMADAGTDTYEVENTLGLMDSERRLLVEIEDALGRIEDGTYGICQSNGELIPKVRLDAIPWARYCVACANLSEKGLLVREDSFDESDYNDQANEEKDDLDSSPSE
ncbi:MAG: TraR/DksA family transcriptional regulator [Planctomycetota bacterium]|jgi:RNA polymerase-binding protein DksA